MATIPLGNFGNDIAQGVRPVATPRGDPIGEAALRTGTIGQNVALEAAQQETQQQQARQRAAATLALARAQNDLHAAHDDVARRVLDGSLPSDKAGPEFQTAAGKIREATFSGYQPDQQAVMAGHLETVQGSLDRSLGAVVNKRQQTETAGMVDQFGEQVSREAQRLGPAWASQKFGAFVDFTGGAAGLTAEQQAKLKASFGERVHATFYENAATGALTRGDAGALGQLVQQLQGPEGDALDPQKRAQLTHQVFGWQQHVLAQKDRAANMAAAEQQRRENAAVDVFNKGADLALSGGYFSPDFIKELTTTAQGTQLERQTLDLIGSQRAIAGFASASAPERAAAIERMRAQRATPGQGTDPLGDKLLQAMVTMDGKMRTQADDNPWAAAQQAGRIQAAPVINAADPQSAVQVVQQRMGMIGNVEQWVGRKVSPLQPAEVEQVGKMVRSLPLDQAANLLGSMGAALGDADRVAALAKQLHDKDGSLGLAMVYANAGTTQGRLTAELVLRGDQAIRDKTVMIDKAAETGWQGTIAKTIRGAYSNREAEDAVVDAAFKIAAAKYAQNGSPDLPEAIKLATGGIVERNGQKFPLPYGMKSEDDLNRALALVAPAQLAEQATDSSVMVGTTPLPAADFLAQLPKATLVHAGQGIYNVRAGTGLVTNSQGKRITLKVGP